MREPVFHIEPPMAFGDRYLVQVRQEGTGLIRKFLGATEKEVTGRAHAFIARARARFYKSLAAVEARRAGRIEQNLKAASGAEKA